VLVCTVQEEQVERVVGTIYYQHASADFVDQDGKELAELGMLAVDPEYTKQFGIGNRLVSQVFRLAEVDQKALYLYAIGSYKEGSYSNHLLQYYANKGFQPAGNRTSSPSSIYTTASKRIDQLVMLYESGGEKIRKITRVATQEEYPIPFL
jgi:predicted N-acetyltransferase YhbS